MIYGNFTGFQRGKVDSIRSSGTQGQAVMREIMRFIYGETPDCQSAYRGHTEPVKGSGGKLRSSCISTSA